MTDLLTAIQNNKAGRIKKLLTSVTKQEWAAAVERSIEQQQPDLTTILMDAPRAFHWVGDVLQEAAADGDRERVVAFLNLDDISSGLQSNILSYAVSKDHEHVVEALMEHPKFNHVVVASFLMTHMDGLSVPMFQILLKGYKLDNDMCELLSISSINKREDFVDILYPLYQDTKIDEVCERLRSIRPSTLFHVQKIRQAQLERQHIQNEVMPLAEELQHRRGAKL